MSAGHASVIMSCCGVLCQHPLRSENHTYACTPDNLPDPSGLTSIRDKTIKQPRLGKLGLAYEYKCDTRVTSQNNIAPHAYVLCIQKKAGQQTSLHKLTVCAVVAATTASVLHTGLCCFNAAR
jgi:hypothetical protein